MFCNGWPLSPKQFRYLLLSQSYRFKFERYFKLNLLILSLKRTISPLCAKTLLISLAIFILPKQKTLAGIFPASRRFYFFNVRDFPLQTRDDLI